MTNHRTLALTFLIPLISVIAATVQYGVSLFRVFTLLLTLYMMFALFKGLNNKSVLLGVLGHVGYSLIVIAMNLSGMVFGEFASFIPVSTKILTLTANAVSLVSRVAILAVVAAFSSEHNSLTAKLSAYQRTFGQVWAVPAVIMFISIMIPIIPDIFSISSIGQLLSAVIVNVIAAALSVLPWLLVCKWAVDSYMPPSEPAQYDYQNNSTGM